MAASSADSLERAFDQIQNETRYNGPTHPVEEFVGDDAISIRAREASDAQIFPTIDDDAQVFQKALKDMVITTGRLRMQGEAGALVSDYLSGNLTLAELKAQSGRQNPFYPLTTQLINSPAWIDYYAQLGFVPFYNVFVRESSSLYQAQAGNIPLTPELFHHGVSALQDQLAQNQARFPTTAGPSGEEARYGIASLGLNDTRKSPLGWSRKALAAAIQSCGQLTFPRYLISRKRWALPGKRKGRDQELNAAVAEFQAAGHNRDAEGHQLYRRVFGASFGFGGYYSEQNAFNDVYPDLGPNVKLRIWPPVGMVMEADQFRQGRNVQRFNMIMIYRHLLQQQERASLAGGRLPPPQPEAGVATLPQFMTALAGGQVQFWEDVDGTMLAYLQQLGSYLFIEREIWYAMTTLEHYRRIVEAPDAFGPGLLAAIATRLGLRYDLRRAFITAGRINKAIAYIKGHLAEFQATRSRALLTSATRSRPSVSFPRAEARALSPTSRSQAISQRLETGASSRQPYQPSDLSAVVSPPRAAPSQRRPAGAVALPGMALGGQLPPGVSGRSLLRPSGERAAAASRGVGESQAVSGIAPRYPALIASKFTAGQASEYSPIRPGAPLGTSRQRLERQSSEAEMEPFDF